MKNESDLSSGMSLLANILQEREREREGETRACFFYLSRKTWPGATQVLIFC